MLNKNGNTENLKEYHENGGVSYRFKKLDDYSFEYTYDENGDELTFKDSNGFSWEKTYDDHGNQLTYKDSNRVSWVRTYDKNGNCLTYKNLKSGALVVYAVYTYDDHGHQLTYKDSNGIERGFENVVVQEFTMEQLVTMVGNFKLIK